MSIKTCVYELIRIELSCGDMREIIFSQDFLQYSSYLYYVQRYFTVLNIGAVKYRGKFCRCETGYPQNFIDYTQNYQGYF